MVRFGYPVLLDLTDVGVLVVGGGPVAARKVTGLAAAGARVRLVAPDIAAELDRECVAELRQRPYERGDLDGVQLVVTATGVRDVDAAVAAEARSAGIWVNAADQPADCTFILPAITRRDPITIAVSTDGSSPALAQRLRDRAATMLTDDVVALAGDLAARRAEIQTARGSTEDVDWSAMIDRVLPP